MHILDVLVPDPREDPFHYPFILHLSSPRGGDHPQRPHLVERTDPSCPSAALPLNTSPTLTTWPGVAEARKRGPLRTAG